MLAKIFVFGKQIIDGFNVLSLKLRAEKIWLILKEIFVISRLTLFGVTMVIMSSLLAVSTSVELVGRPCESTLFI